MPVSLASLSPLLHYFETLKKVRKRFLFVRSIFVSLFLFSLVFKNLYTGDIITKTYE